MRSALILAALAFPAHADVLADQEQQQIKLFTKIAPSVIFINDSHSLGTGFIISTDGLALTAAHVVGTNREVNVVLHGGKRARAKVVAVQTDFDLALIDVAVDRVPPPLPLATADTVRVGQWVGAVGHGLGGVWAFTTGMVSNAYEAEHGAKLVQTQIPLNPGNSGGPIFDRSGRVLAVVSKGATAANSMNIGVQVADAFLVFDQLLPLCDCLAIDVAGKGTAVFLDDQLAGKGPRVLVHPTPGSHTVSTVIGGKQIERTIKFPAEKRVVLR